MEDNKRLFSLVFTHVTQTYNVVLHSTRGISLPHPWSSEWFHPLLLDAKYLSTAWRRSKQLSSISGRVTYSNRIFYLHLPYGSARESQETCARQGFSVGDPYSFQNNFQSHHEMKGDEPSSSSSSFVLLEDVGGTENLRMITYPSHYKFLYFAADRHLVMFDTQSISIDDILSERMDIHYIGSIVNFSCHNQYWNWATIAANANQLTLNWTHVSILNEKTGAFGGTIEWIPKDLLIRWCVAIVFTKDE